MKTDTIHTEEEVNNQEEYIKKLNFEIHSLINLTDLSRHLGGINFSYREKYFEVIEDIL